MEEEQNENTFLSRIGNGAGIVFDAIGSGWQKAGNAVLAGWDKASDALGSGLEWLGEKIADWTGRAEAYMQEKQWDKKVHEAWDTLKAGTQHTGEMAQDKLDEAYLTVKNWLAESSETADPSVAEAVDGIAAAAGAAEAKLSGWYRKMEAYMTEKADLVTDSAAEAWEIIKQNAAVAGSVTSEALDSASETLRQWLSSVGEGEASEAIQSLDFLTQNAHDPE